MLQYVTIYGITLHMSCNVTVCNNITAKNKGQQTKHSYRGNLDITTHKCYRHTVLMTLQLITLLEH